MYTIIRYYKIINTPTGQNFRLRAIRYNGVNEDKEKKIIMRLESQGYECELHHFSNDPIYCVQCGDQVVGRRRHLMYSSNPNHTCSPRCWGAWFAGQEYDDVLPPGDGDGYEFDDY